MNTIDEFKTSKANEEAKKNEQKQYSQIVTPAHVNQGSVVGRFVKAMLAENLDNLGNHILFNIMAPKASDAVHGILTGIIDTVFKHKTTTNNSASTYTRSWSNSAWSNGVQNTANNAVKMISSSVYNIYGIDYNTEADALEILSMLKEIISMEKDHSVSVSQYYQLIGVAPKPIDNTWGWKNLDNVGVSIIFKNGETKWKIDFPKPVSLN